METLITLPILFAPRRAGSRSLHIVLSLATSFAALQLGHQNRLLSLSVVCLQVSLGRPLLRLLSGVHDSGTVWFSSFHFRSTWPIHLHLLQLMLSPIVLVLFFSFSSILLILFSQNTRMILLGHLLLNASHFLMSATVIFQHSEPYISTDLTLLLLIFNLFFMLKRLTSILG